MQLVAGLRSCPGRNQYKLIDMALQSATRLIKCWRYPMGLLPHQQAASITGAPLHKPVVCPVLIDRASAHSANAFLGIEVNTNVADLSDKVQAVHESDRRRFQLPFRYLHTGHLLSAFFERRRLCASGFLKEADPPFKVVCSVRDSLLLRD